MRIIPPIPYPPDERFLRAAGIPYTRLEDGTLEATGNITLTGIGLLKLPDLSRVILHGSFYCDNNPRLASLKGAPKVVTGDFACHYTAIASMEDGPVFVGGSVWCSMAPNLESLAGAPVFVGEDFHCLYNPKLASLRGVPEIVCGAFDCSSNPSLAYIDQAPRMFGTMKFNGSIYKTWDEVPETLRMSKAAHEALELKRSREHKASATTLRRALPVRRVKIGKPPGPH